MNPAVISDVRKIAVLQVNALGDYIFALPALEALRRTYPEAEIVLIAKEWHRAFLTGRPGPVDRVVAMPPLGGGNEGLDKGIEEEPNQVMRFLTAMAQEQFDLAIQMHDGGRHSNPFILRLGAHLTVGLKARDAAPLDRWVPYVFFQSEIMRYLEVVALVGGSPLELEPRMAVIDADLTEADRVLAGHNAPVALHPGASHPMRRWPPEKFARAGDALAAAGAQVVVTGTEGERCLVEAVISSMRERAINLCGQLSLGGLAGLLSRCRVVVSNDSGPLHLAGAVGTPTVGLYWCLNVPTASPLTRTRHRLHISWRTHCSICGGDQALPEQRCTHPASYATEIPIEPVVESALELYSLSA